MSGSVYLIGELLAKHRTRDGGRHSDPKGSGLRKIPEIEAAWESRAKPYRLWALFCEDFLDYVSEIGPLPEAVSYYGRWSRLWSNRATIHAEQAGISDRVKALVSNLRSGAYRDQWAGGFGPRSLVKDGLNAIGLRFG